MRGCFLTRRRKKQEICQRGPKFNPIGLVQVQVARQSGGAILFPLLTDSDSMFCDLCRAEREQRMKSWKPGSSLTPCSSTVAPMACAMSATINRDIRIDPKHTNYVGFLSSLPLPPRGTTFGSGSVPASASSPEKGTVASARPGRRNLRFRAIAFGLFRPDSEQKGLASSSPIFDTFDLGSLRRGREISCASVSIRRSH